MMAMLAGGVNAKTLVNCSEGSPEGFELAPYTAGTIFDASACTVYSRLVEFADGSTSIMPDLADSWTI